MKKLLFAIILIPLFLYAENPQQFDADKNPSVTDKKINRIIEQIADPNFRKIRVGSFTTRNGTGSQSVTGVGVRPKAVILFQGRGDTTYSTISFGASDGTNSFSWGMGEIDGDVAGSFNQTSGVFRVVNNAGSTVTLATLTSFDSDGFTLNFTANATGGETASYIIFE